MESRPLLTQYTLNLVDRFAQMSATAALVFYSLFVMSARPELIFTIPVVLFGLYRYWFVVDVLDGGESPTDAILSDFQLLATVLVKSIQVLISTIQNNVRFVHAGGVK